MHSIRPQTVTLAAVAVIIGLVTAYGAKRMLEPKPTVEVPQPPLKTTSIVVAMTNLTPYARIGGRDVGMAEIPADDAPSAALHVKGRVLGRLVKTTILAGTPIREEDLYAPGTVPQMADQLPPGFRAVTIRVPDAIASNGAILPGSHVDVSLTFDSDHPEVSGMATINLMRNLQVLAPSPTAKNPVLTDEMRDKNYLTVAATPEQANRLILAQRYGTINVTLCSNNEKASDALAYGSRNLINKYELLGLPPLPPPPLEPTPEPPVYKVVEVYRGKDVQHVVFNEAGELVSPEGVASALLASNPGATGQKKKTCPTCNKKKVRYSAPSPRAPSSSGNTLTTTGGASGAGGTGQPTLARRPTELQPTPAAPSADNP
ncbi:MAG: Flp pilus assembly protein CpaB [Pirellulales bacterium]|nr:Flp pilus assembly protein CpaB [Pirellulales bacterium]